MKILGTVSGQNLADCYSLSQEMKFSGIVHSSYAPKRKEVWYRVASNLQGKATEKLWRCRDPHERFVQLGNRLLPGWHSMLSCFGNQKQGSSSSISLHRDHRHFKGESVMLNLGESYYYEAAPEGEYQTEYTDRGRVIPVKLKRYLLKPGMIVLIDTKKLHSAEQLSEVRYNHTFRYIKDEYLSLVQS